MNYTLKNATAYQPRPKASQDQNRAKPIIKDAAKGHKTLNFAFRIGC
jgi:hypothetical protein